MKCRILKRRLDRAANKARQKRLRTPDTSIVSNLEAVDDYMWKLDSDAETMDAVPAALQVLEDEIAWHPLNADVRTGLCCHCPPATIGDLS